MFGTNLQFWSKDCCVPCTSRHLICKFHLFCHQKEAGLLHLWNRMDFFQFKGMILEFILMGLKIRHLKCRAKIYHVTFTITLHLHLQKSLKKEKEHVPYSHSTHSRHPCYNSHYTFNYFFKGWRHLVAFIDHYTHLLEIVRQELIN